MRRLALVLGVIATVAWWYLLEDLSLAGVVLLSAYMITPWLSVAAEWTPLRPGGRATALVVLALMTVATYLSADESSTAAIGVLLLPVYQWIAVAVIAVCDAARVRARRD